MHVNAYVSSNFTDPQMIFKMNGQSTIVSGNHDGNTWNFDYPYIFADNMADEITMEIVCDDTLLYSKVYSVQEYCNDLYTECYEDEDISEAELPLVTLLSDILSFGAASQNYTGHNTAFLAGAYTWVEEYKSDFTEAPVSDYEIIISPQCSSDSIIAAGANISQDIKLYVMFYADKATQLTITDSLGTQSFDISELAPEDNIYKIYSSGLSASQLSEIFNICLYNEEELLTEITYSVNSYVARYYNSENTVLKDIVRAMYLYGASAANYLS